MAGSTITKVSWGPFAPHLMPEERMARLRVLRALALVFAHSHASIHDVLRRAEVNPTLKRLELAEKIFDHDLPSIAKRRILATYCDLVNMDARRPGDPKP